VSLQETNQYTTGSKVFTEWLKIIVFWYVTPRSPLKVNWCMGRLYNARLQGWRAWHAESTTKHTAVQLTFNGRPRRQNSLNQYLSRAEWTAAASCNTELYSSLHFQQKWATSSETSLELRHHQTMT
jgi:hypothetical protein